MRLDAEAYAIHLHERQQLQLAIFNPRLHPRDLWGRFRDVLDPMEVPGGDLITYVEARQNHADALQERLSEIQLGVREPFRIYADDFHSLVQDYRKARALGIGGFIGSIAWDDPDTMNNILSVLATIFRAIGSVFGVDFDFLGGMSYMAQPQRRARGSDKSLRMRALYKRKMLDSTLSDAMKKTLADENPFDVLMAAMLLHRSMVK